MNKTKIVLRKMFTQRNPHTTMKHTPYLLKTWTEKKTLYYSLLDSHLRPLDVTPKEAFFRISSYSREYEYFIYKETNEKVP